MRAPSAQPDTPATGARPTTAELHTPASIAVDPNGNLLIADSLNSAVRLVNATTGDISTIAGQGPSHAGYSGDGGAATTADLDEPGDIAVDPLGNVYISDTLNGRVREVSGVTGDISTVAGTGAASVSDNGGSATEAGVPGPIGIGVSATGHFVLAETFQEVVRGVNDAHPGSPTAMSLPNTTSDTSHVWSYRYDAEGNVISSTDHYGDTTAIGYNGQGLPVITVPPNGTAASDPYTYATTTTYDALGDVTSSTSPPTSAAPAGVTTTSTYNHDQKATKVVNNAGNTTTSTYDATDRLCWTIAKSEASPTCGSPPSGATVYGYDSHGNVDSVTNGDTKTIALAHTDPAYPTKVTKQTRPDGSNSTTYSYDADGNLTKTTDALGNVVSDGYDADNRPWYVYAGTTSAACGSAPGGAITYSYNTNGQRSQMVDASGTTTYTYDNAGRVASVQLVSGSTTFTTGYKYNDAGDPTCIAYPLAASSCGSSASRTNPIVQRGYDDADRLVSVADWLGNTTDFTLNANGATTKVTYPTGTGGTGLKATATLSYATTGALASDDLSAPGSTATSIAVTRNTLGLITSETTGPSAATYQAGTNRLTSMGSSGPTFGYDTAGQLCWSDSASGSGTCGSPPSGSGVTTYTYDSGGDGQLTKTNSGSGGSTITSFQDNADGERCWGTHTGTSSAACSAPPTTSSTYGWNGLGELCYTATSASGSCSSPPSGATTYTYNGNGLRATLTPVSGTPLRFLWDTVTNGATTPELLSDATTAYIYGPNLMGQGSAPIEQIALPLSTGNPSYLFSDPQGVNTLFSPSGTKENGYTYTTYGKRTAMATPTGATPFGFQGGYSDASGLEYLVHRYYTPKVGQFLSVDPTVLKTVQAYAFARDDPVNQTDPNGRCSGGCPGFKTFGDRVFATAFSVFAGIASAVAIFGVFSAVEVIPTIVAIVAAALAFGSAAYGTYEAACKTGYVTPHYL